MTWAAREGRAVRCDATQGGRSLAPAGQQDTAPPKTLVLLEGPFIQQRPWNHVADQHVALAVHSAQQSCGVAAGGDGPSEPWSMSMLYRKVQLGAAAAAATAAATAVTAARGANGCPLGSDERRSTPLAHPSEGHDGHTGREGSSSATVVMTKDASAGPGRDACRCV